MSKVIICVLFIVLLSFFTANQKKHAVCLLFVHKIPVGATICNCVSAKIE